MDRSQRKACRGIQKLTDHKYCQCQSGTAFTWLTKRHWGIARWLTCLKISWMILIFSLLEYKIFLTTSYSWWYLWTWSSLLRLALAEVSLSETFPNVRVFDFSAADNSSLSPSVLPEAVTSVPFSLLWFEALWTIERDISKEFQIKEAYYSNDIWLLMKMTRPKKYGL